MALSRFQRYYYKNRDAILAKKKENYKRKKGLTSKERSNKYKNYYQQNRLQILKKKKEKRELTKKSGLVF